MFNTIRKTAAATLAAATLLGATSLAAQAGQDFTIENASGVDIYEVYISPSTSDSWGRDMLGDDVFLDGETADVGMRAFGDECIYDLSFIDVYGDALEFYGVDVCATPSLVIN